MASGESPMQPMTGKTTAAAVVATLIAPLGARANAPQQVLENPDAFVDSVARELHAAAVAHWQNLDESLEFYTARIEQRMAAAVRTALKDRVVYRNESAMRVLWQRDAEPAMQVLGTRTRYPGHSTDANSNSLRWLRDMPFDEPFDPAGDRLLFGLAREAADSGDTNVRSRTEIRNLGIVGPSDDFWFAHPLAEDSDAEYRFRSGDTLTLSFPDGSRLEAVQLDVLPKEADPHLISGTLWIEPGSGALVRAVYQLARPLDMMRDMPEPEPGQRGPPFIPPMLRPLVMKVSFVSVSYSLWDNLAWMPHAMRMEAEIQMGMLKFPVSFEMSYRMESVVLAADESKDAVAEFVAESLEYEDGVSYEVIERPDPGGAESRTLILPADRSLVTTSPHLPPPIWDEGGGFLTEDDVAEFAAALAMLPAAPPPAATGRWTLDWPWTREGLLRYNRVEGLAASARGEAALGRRFTLATTASLGLADLRPRARIGLERSTTLRRLSLAAYDELHATDPAGDYLGTGNSARALFLGRDYGDYYQTIGAEVAWRPPATARESFGIRLYGECQTPVETEAGFALFRVFDDDWRFRPNPIADEVEEAGAELRLSPWWGSDPARAQFGLDLYVHGATWRFLSSGTPVGGDRPADDTRDDYVRASAIARTVIPLSGGAGNTWRLGAEAGAGTVWGDAPTQRAWPLGGPATLRGFQPGAVSGTTFMRGRLEVAPPMGDLGFGFFGDAGWAGERNAFDVDDILYSVGFGVTIMNGLMRVDLARAVNGPDPGIRIHVHVDAIM